MVCYEISKLLLAHCRVILYTSHTTYGLLVGHSHNGALVSMYKRQFKTVLILRKHKVTNRPVILKTTKIYELESP